MSAPNRLVVIIIGIGIDALAHPRVASAPDPRLVAWRSAKRPPRYACHLRKRGPGSSAER